MPAPTNPVIRPGLFFGALGTLLLSAGQAMAAAPPGPVSAGFTPDFFVELSTDTGLSSNPDDPFHPSGQLGFKFLEGGTCTDGNICLDLSVWNTSNENPGGILSSQMVSAAFNVPGIDGLAIPNFATTPGSYVSNTSSLYTCNSTDGCVAGALVNAFSVQPNNEISNIAFDVCATSQNDCQSGGQPNGLQNGEFTIVRFLFPYAPPSEGGLSAAEIADEFRNFYTYADMPENATDFNVIGRWQSVECAGTPCAGSDKIGGGIPGEPGPRESVPGPLPLVGAAAAFGFSRKLRQRIAAERMRAPYML